MSQLSDSQSWQQAYNYLNAYRGHKWLLPKLVPTIDCLASVCVTKQLDTMPMMVAVRVWVRATNLKF